MDPMFIVVAALFAAVFALLVIKIFRHGGFKAAMFGARIERTIGEVSGERQGLVGVKVRVHLLDRDSKGKLVGIELTAKSVASFQMMPITLSSEDATQLAEFLKEAARESHGS